MAKAACQPGEWMFHDFRPSLPRPRPVSSHSPPPSSPVPLRVGQWNIERGYQLDLIIAELRALDPDVLSLQEVDVDCERSGSIDTGMAIAAALQLNYCYLCEFHELYSEMRPPLVQGGERGHHGHAVLSKFDMRSFSVLRHSHQPVDWAKEGEIRKEPRRGERVTLKVVVDCGGVDVLIYNAHFEVFCGLLDRVTILADILQDSREEQSAHPHQMILADCNTMAHGIARFSPLYCTDSMRWRSLGWTESEWWHHFILDVPDSSGPINRRVLPFFPPPSPLPALLRNPGFSEPFHPYDDVTLINHHKLYQAKLDWMLMKGGIVCKRHWLGNDEYRASDHKWMAMDVEVGGEAKEGGQKGWVKRRRRWPGVCTFTTDDRVYTAQWLIVLSGVVALLSYFVVR